MWSGRSLRFFVPIGVRRGGFFFTTAAVWESSAISDEFCPLFRSVEVTFNAFQAILCTPFPPGYSNFDLFCSTLKPSEIVSPAPHHCVVPLLRLVSDE